MSTVYLNGSYLPMAEARISPMDRGFLFGDGIYEVIPCYQGRLVGFGPHMRRMQDGLDAIGIKLHLEPAHWEQIATTLAERNGGGNLGIYLHVSRGADVRRHHAYPEDIAPTLFAFAFEIPPAPVADKSAAPRYRVSVCEDMRWRRCHIKSTALLGNVMHYQVGHGRGHDETILHNQAGEITEAAACNVFIVKDGTVITPPLDQQKLPGITRQLLLDMLRRHSDIPVREETVTLDQLYAADEVWLTSSSKEVAPVVEIEGRPVANGEVGDIWLAAQTLFVRHRFDY